MSSLSNLHNVSRENNPLPGLLISPYGASCIKIGSNKKPVLYDEVTFSNGRDFEEVIEGLKGLVKKCKLKKVNLVVPESEITTIFMVAARKKGQKVKTVISEYIKNERQISLEEVVYDFDIIAEEGNIIQASIVLMTKEKYDWYKKVLSKLKIKPVRFISENTSLSKALVTEDNNEPHVIVNITPQYATMSLVENNIVYKTEYINECLDISNVDRIKKSINSFILEWYSKTGRVVHERAQHLIINTYNEELTKDLIKQTRNTLSHINIQKGNGWTNCFDLDEYIPEIHKKDLYRFNSVIGGSLFGRK